LTFGNYLNLCRKHYNLTQEEFVSQLYSFDNKFEGLDVRTLSRWENAQTQPPAQKQIQIIKYFQIFSCKIFPCFDEIDSIEEHICLRGVENLIGNSKEHIINFPQNIFQIDDIQIKHLRSMKDIDNILDMPESIISSMTSNLFDIKKEHLKKWALHPSNLFLIAKVKNQFMGMFFCLKLKHRSFEKILSLKLKFIDLSDDDFARFDEKGSIFHLSFFTYNELIASLFYIRYYAYLINNQEYIKDIGTTPVLESAKKLLEKIHVKHLKDKRYKNKKVSIYKSPLEDVLLNENLFRIIFTKQTCPQEKN
jgi:transcriptional regulator with XRE-family HTH domain